MKVFLSYASEDSAAAAQIAEWLDAKGVAFYDFRSPARHGGRFATRRPDAIEAADFFIVLLSTGLLQSEWCRQDLEIAERREQLPVGGDPGTTFIQVLQVAHVPQQYEGELRRFGWLDVMTASLAESSLRELAYRLGIERRPAITAGSRFQAVTHRGTPAPVPERADRAERADQAATAPGDRTDDKHKRIMVIYGHDEEANSALFDCLRAMGLKPQEWGQLIQQSQVGSPYIGAVLDEAFKSVQAVVAFFTPDEHVITRTSYASGQDSWRLQARPNVLFEAGMALATHPRETILLVLGNQELPSDLSGRHFIRLDGTVIPLKNLGDRLKTAGCAVELDGNDWLNPARFPNRDSIQARIGKRRRPPSGEG
jgi:predicted nucleotide-binding protein